MNSWVYQYYEQLTHHKQLDPSTPYTHINIISIPILIAITTAIITIASTTITIAITTIMITNPIASSFSREIDAFLNLFNNSLLDEDKYRFRSICQHIPLQINVLLDLFVNISLAENYRVKLTYCQIYDQRISRWRLILQINTLLDL